jgi:hypothetical protein
MYEKYKNKNFAPLFSPQRKVKHSTENSDAFFPSHTTGNSRSNREEEEDLGAIKQTAPDKEGRVQSEGGQRERKKKMSKHNLRMADKIAF